MASIAIDQHHIPRPATPLVGRVQEIARVSALLSQPDARLVTLTGPGGVGKTRLALEIAHTVDRAVTGEVAMVPLAAVSEGESVLPAIARGLGIGLIEAMPVEQRLIDAIGDRCALLILDNAEQIADHLTPLATILGHCPNLKVLVTSRIMLRLSSEIVFPVEPLPTTSDPVDALAPAIALFIARAQALRPDLPLEPDDIRAIDDICRQVDGLPLAIELAAARTRFLSPVALRDRLCERLPVLVGGPRDAPERHQTMRATLLWSHDLLTRDEKTLFRRLAIFSNGAPWDAVEPVCNADGALGHGAEEILGSLIDHSLVRVVERPATGPRVRLLNTIREFAAEQLNQIGEAKGVADAHAAWFANLVTSQPDSTWRTGTDTLRDWTMRHEPDSDNLLRALATLFEAGEPEPVVRLAGGLASFWIEVGLFHEGREWTRRVLPLVEAVSDEVKAVFLFKAGLMAGGIEEFEESRAIVTRAVALARRVGNQRLEANTLNLLGAIHWKLGQPAEGERLQREAIELVRQVDDTLGGALFQTQIAGHLLEAGELDRAEAMLREALPDIWRHRPDGARLIQGSLAHLVLLRGDLDEAGEHLEGSLAYHVEPPHRNPATLGERLVDAARLAAERGHPEAAARLLGASLALYERMGFATYPDVQECIEPVRQSLVDPLGEERLARGLATGRSMPVPAVIELALEVARMRDHAPANGEAVAPGNGLTERQLEILRLLVAGRSNAVIAKALFISERTVTTHLTRIYDRLGVSTRAEAIVRATQLGIQPPARAESDLRGG